MLNRLDGRGGKASKTDDTDGQAADVLKRYETQQAARAEKVRVSTMEKDLYSLRSVVSTMTALTSKPLEPVRRRERTSNGTREAAAVALLSDFHCEQVVRKGETPTGNEYNPTIAEKSLQRFFSGYRWLIDFHRNAFAIRDVVLWLGGDLMTGHIHEENKETTASAPIATLLWLRSRIVAGIDSLLDDPNTETVTVVCSYGNHGRNTGKPFRAKGAVHSYEWLLYQWLASHFEGNPRVRFLADESAHQYLTVYDFDLHFHHGDEVNYQGGVGGITIPLNKAVAQWDIAKRCHYHNFGHFHQYIDTGRVAVNGSVIGFDAYSMSIKATPEPPQQAFYLLDSKRGKTCRSPIWVRD
ncbi:hypothetical protein AKJ09_00076 [Labilithrix luteola]|uniref:Calcineurin-like phosphoesterase domain-containing protein n=1 Tax=Labilithrix luteola TaxID=1391654 RepID=A0A0K1PJR0_9BACT|nr:hypothetical protein AKJ09_00008 [Labilithrix luteola]AKU93412.1 hypothetical protein AKJ09_00076 [Labilithrix luteola]